MSGPPPIAGETAGGSPEGPPPRTRSALTVVVAVVVVVLVGAVAVWWFVLRDDAPSQVAVGGGSACTAAAAGTADGAWVVAPGENVFVGYRIDEIFAADTIKKTAVGRTATVRGNLVVDGATVPTATVTADLTNLRSDQSRRDNFIKGQALQTSTFPEATFTLTEPIRLPADLGPCAEVKATATGDLTLHGTTRSVAVPVTARRNGDRIEVSGGIPVTLGDYGIAAPEIGGFVKVDPSGTMELQLAFARQ